MARSSTDTKTTTRRPGGRAASVVAAVHQATIALLTEVGYDGLQLPEVANRAGVNKTTVYRRWPTKAALVSELFLALSEHDRPSTDTGSLLDDLTLLLTDIVRLLATPVAQALLRASLAGQVEQSARASFWTERVRRSAVIVDRAIERGELRQRTNPRLFFEQSVSPIYFRTLVTGEPISKTDIRRFAQHAITAATSGPH